MLDMHTHQELSICSLRTTYTLYTYRKYDFSFEKFISQTMTNVKLTKPPTSHFSQARNIAIHHLGAYARGTCRILG